MFSIWIEMEIFCADVLQAMSPDGEAIVTGAGDETLRFWNVFSKTRSTKVSVEIDSIHVVHVIHWNWHVSRLLSSCNPKPIISAFGIHVVFCPKDPWCAADKQKCFTRRRRNRMWRGKEKKTLKELYERRWMNYWMNVNFLSRRHSE